MGQYPRLSLSQPTCIDETLPNPTTQTKKPITLGGDLSFQWFNFDLRAVRAAPPRPVVRLAHATKVAVCWHATYLLQRAGQSAEPTCATTARRRGGCSPWPFLPQRISMALWLQRSGSDTILALTIWPIECAASYEPSASWRGSAASAASNDRVIGGLDMPTKGTDWEMHIVRKSEQRRGGSRRRTVGTSKYFTTANPPLAIGHGRRVARPWRQLAAGNGNASRRVASLA